MNKNDLRIFNQLLYVCINQHLKIKFGTRSKTTDYSRVYQIKLRQ